MTVDATNSVSQYVGNGTQTFFPFTFQATDSFELYVIVDGELKRESRDYTRQVNGITFLAAPRAGALILIARLTDITQLRDFYPFEDFRASKTELAVDKLIIIKGEAIDFRARLNLATEREVDRVTIVSDKGVDPVIGLWSGVGEDDSDLRQQRAGAFNGEVNEDFLPVRGARGVENYVFMSWDAGGGPPDPPDPPSGGTIYAYGAWDDDVFMYEIDLDAPSSTQVAGGENMGFPLGTQMFPFQTDENLEALLVVDQNQDSLSLVTRAAGVLNISASASLPVFGGLEGGVRSAVFRQGVLYYPDASNGSIDAHTYDGTLAFGAVVRESATQSDGEWRWVLDFLDSGDSADDEMGSVFIAWNQDGDQTTDPTPFTVSDGLPAVTLHEAGRYQYVGADQSAAFFSIAWDRSTGEIITTRTNAGRTYAWDFDIGTRTLTQRGLITISGSPDGQVGFWSIARCGGYYVTVTNETGADTFFDVWSLSGTILSHVERVILDAGRRAGRVQPLKVVSDVVFVTSTGAFDYPVLVRLNADGTKAWEIQLVAPTDPNNIEARNAFNRANDGWSRLFSRYLLPSSS